MGKKNDDKKKKINRSSTKDTPKKKKSSNKKKSTEKKKSNKKNSQKNIKDDSQNISEEEDNFEEILIIGQKHPTPPAGDATRAFYESLLEQRPDSIMAKRYCVDYGCLDNDKAKEFIKILENHKKKKK